MDYPKTIIKGTTIRIGPRPESDNFAEQAVGIEFTLHQDVYLANPNYSPEGSYTLLTDLKVLANPNGWPYDKVIYSVNLIYDEIIQKSSSEVAKIVLTTVEKEE